MYKICVVGLGYVGLPLAVALSKKYAVTGYDIKKSRVDDLISGNDRTLELSQDELQQAKDITFTSNEKEIATSNVYIITVPTPIDMNNIPDLTPVIKATELVGKHINYGDMIIYESTVYPGATEEICVPILERQSSLRYNKDFFVGYSPERINPGDKENRLENIKKVTSGSNLETANKVDEIYKSIIHAGTYLASSIRVAEAAKVIENVQRDVNIALINELHQIFTNLNINTLDVIEAASTKWNFMKLTPGLVGGHCISVDPYYLIHKSQATGYIPDLMKKAREINNSMPAFIINDFVNFLLKNEINPVRLNVLILGFSFKSNCPDIRNTKVYDVYTGLINKGFNVKVFDDLVNVDEVYQEYGLDIINDVNDIDFDEYTVGFMGTQHDSMREIEDNLKYFYNFK